MHNRLPYTWTSPSLWHSPCAVGVLPISQRGCWSANCSLVSSSWATGARSIPVDLSTSLVNGTCPKARVEGRSTPELVAASAPVRHPHLVVVLIVARLTLLERLMPRFPRSNGLLPALFSPLQGALVMQQSTAKSTNSRPRRRS